MGADYADQGISKTDVYIHQPAGFAARLAQVYSADGGGGVFGEDGVSVVAPAPGHGRPVNDIEAGGLGQVFKLIQAVSGPQVRIYLLQPDYVSIYFPQYIGYTLRQIAKIQSPAMMYIIRGNR